MTERKTCLFYFSLGPYFFEMDSGRENSPAGVGPQIFIFFLRKFFRAYICLNRRWQKCWEGRPSERNKKG